jgi:hypothetical protein
VYRCDGGKVVGVRVGLWSPGESGTGTGRQDRHPSVQLLKGRGTKDGG